MHPFNHVLSRLLTLSTLLLAGVSATAQFGAVTSLVSFGETTPLRAADVDGDTDLDLIGLYDGQTFKWYSNTDGAGDFAPLQTAIDVTTNVGLWEIADLDGDALADIVFLDGMDVYLLTNTGGGTFAIPELIGTLPSEPGALTLADITGEGFRDVVVTLSIDLSSFGIGWLPNAGGGCGPLITFDPGMTGPVPTNLAAADIDMTGGVDLVVGGSNQELFAIRNMAGDGSTWQLDVMLSGPDYAYERVQLIDVDNDGDLDVAEAGAIALHWAENHTGEGGAWTEFTDHILEPWTTAGRGMFGKLGCGAEASAVYVPSNPGLPVRYTAWANGINTFAYSNDLPDIERGTGALLVDLNGDGRDELVLSTADGAVWFVNTASPPTASVVLPALDPLCLYGPGVDLPEASPTGGRWSGLWVIDNVLHRANLGSTTNHPLAYTAYEPEGCPIAGTGTVFVAAEPMISPNLPNPLCSSIGPIQMTSVPPATQWIGLGPTGVLDPGTFNGQIFVAIYVDPTGTDCAAESDPVVIWPTLPAEIAPTGPFCINDGPQLIVASAQPPIGAYWSGDISTWNTTGATFLPSQGAGTYQVILHVDPTGPQQCANSDTLLIAVSDAIPSIEITPLGPQCAAGSAIALDGATPSGGTWNGPGVSNGTLDPTTIGAGTYFLTYTYEEPGGCAASEALRLELYDATHVNWSVPDLIFCGTDEVAQFTALPVGGTWSQPVENDGTIDPALLAPGSYPLEYTWIGPNGCTLVNVATNIELWNDTEVVIDSVGLLCDNGVAVALTGSPGGLWGGSVTGPGSTILFDPTLFGAGTWPVSLTATAEGYCPGSTSMDITVEVCTSITDDLEMASVVLSPNPFQERFTIAMGQEKILQIEVLDATGRLVSMATGPFNSAAPIGFDLSGQPNGAYVVRIHGNGSVYRVRAIKAD